MIGNRSFIYFCKDGCGYRFFFRSSRCAFRMDLGDTFWVVLCIVCWLFVLSSKYSSAILRLLSPGKYCMFFYWDDSLLHWRLCCLPGNVCSENDFVSNLLQPELVLVPTYHKPGSKCSKYGWKNQHNWYLWQKLSVLIISRDHILPLDWCCHLWK